MQALGEIVAGGVRQREEIAAGQQQAGVRLGIPEGFQDRAERQVVGRPGARHRSVGRGRLEDLFQVVDDEQKRCLAGRRVRCGAGALEDLDQGLSEGGTVFGDLGRPGPCQLTGSLARHRAQHGLEHRRCVVVLKYHDALVPRQPVGDAGGQARLALAAHAVDQHAAGVVLLSELAQGLLSLAPAADEGLRRRHRDASMHLVEEFVKACGLASASARQLAAADRAAAVWADRKAREVPVASPPMLRIVLLGCQESEAGHARRIGRAPAKRQLAVEGLRKVRGVIVVDRAVPAQDVGHAGTGDLLGQGGGLRRPLGGTAGGQENQGRLGLA